MSVQGNLQRDEAQLEQDEASLRTTVAAQVSDIQAEVDSLKGQIPDPAALDAVDQKLQQLHQAVTADTAAVAAADPGAPAPAPQPPSPTPPPTPTPAPGPAPTPAPTPGPTQTVYVFDGDPSAVDPSQWSRSGFDTVDSPPRPLFYFSGDTAPGDTNGANVDNWHMYSGSVQPSTT